MTRPLDGIALLTYFRRLKLSREAQELLTHIRTSPPSRTPEARRGDMPIWYPSNNFGKGQTLLFLSLIFVRWFGETTSEAEWEGARGGRAW